jgi:hypothetical protein
MPSITDLDELISLASSTGASCDSQFFHKTIHINGSPTTDITMTFMTGRKMSYWRFDGQPCGGITGDINSNGGLTGSVCNLGTTGAIPYTNAQNGNDKWMIQAGAAGSVSGTFIVYDRLYHNHNLNGTTITEQSVQGEPPNPAITRYTDGVGNMVFVEIYTTIGASLTTIRMNYTNQDGVTGCVSEQQMIGNNGRRESPTILVMPLKKGDTGVRAVKSVTLTATTGTIGNFGVVIGHPIAMFGSNNSGTCAWRDYTNGLPGIPNVPNDSCLAVMYSPTTATTPEIFGNLTMVET